MQNLSLTEIGFIVLLALIVLGPKRLPEIARNLGKAWRVFQAETKKAQGVFKEAFDEVDAVTREATTAINAGVVDRPDGAAPVTPTPAGPAPGPKQIEGAARLAPVAARIYEDT